MKNNLIKRYNYWLASNKAKYVSPIATGRIILPVKCTLSSIWKLCPLYKEDVFLECVQTYIKRAYALIQEIKNSI